MVKHVDDEEEDDDNSDDEMTLGELHFTCRHELWHCFAVGLMMVPILMMEPMMDTDDADLNLEWWWWQKVAKIFILDSRTRLEVFRNYFEIL